MWFDLTLSIFAGIFLLIGLIGVIVPVLPGIPLAWLGLLLAFFSKYNSISLFVLIICGIVTIIVSVLDNIFPAVFTKKSGGSKWGSVGSFIGIIIGFFFGPFGIFVGAFLGALLGELFYDSSDFKRSFSAALGSLKGFVFGIGIKLVSCAIFVWIFVYGFFAT